MNYYDILEVSSKASPAVIKAAYKSLVQRYHPDKNNNDAASAQRTTQLVQAYEVLSDEARRAGYDQQMQSQELLRRAPGPHAASMLNRAAAYPPRKPAQEAQGYGVVWLVIITTIVLAMWFLLSPSKPATPVQRPASAGESAVVRTDPLSKDVPANPSLANHRLVMLEISVNLSETDKLPAGFVKKLKIPVLSLGTSYLDAKKLLWHLDDRKVQLRQNIETKLELALSAQLLPETGAKYVQELVLQTVTEMATAQSPELAAQAYNIEIDLPKAFTIGVYEKTLLQVAPVK